MFVRECVTGWLCLCGGGGVSWRDLIGGVQTCSDKDCSSVKTYVLPLENIQQYKALGEKQNIPGKSDLLELSQPHHVAHHNTRRKESPLFTYADALFC